MPTMRRQTGLDDLPCCSTNINRDVYEPENLRRYPSVARSQSAPVETSPVSRECQYDGDDFDGGSKGYEKPTSIFSIVTRSLDYSLSKGNVSGMPISSKKKKKKKDKEKDKIFETPCTQPIPIPEVSEQCKMTKYPVEMEQYEEEQVSYQPHRSHWMNNNDTPINFEPKAHSTIVWSDQERRSDINKPPAQFGVPQSQHPAQMYAESFRRQEQERYLNTPQPPREPMNQPQLDRPQTRFSDQNQFNSQINNRSSFNIHYQPSQSQQYKKYDETSYLELPQYQRPQQQQRPCLRQPTMNSGHSMNPCRPQSPPPPPPQPPCQVSFREQQQPTMSQKPKCKCKCNCPSQLNQQQQQFINQSKMMYQKAPALPRHSEQLPPSMQPNNNNPNALNLTMSMAAMPGINRTSINGTQTVNGRSIPVIFPEDMTPEERFNHRTKALLFETLVKDHYCPGVIQDSLNGADNFNDYAYELAFAGVIPPKPEPIDPLSMLEAIKLRIDHEREEVRKQFGWNSIEFLERHTLIEPERGPSGRDRGHLYAEDISKHFATLFQTELNDAISAYLKAESFYKHNEQHETGNDYDVEVSALNTSFFGLPIKCRLYNATTRPIHLNYPE